MDDLDAIGWKYYIVYVVILIFEVGFLYVFLVETKGRTLEETSALFDGLRDNVSGQREVDVESEKSSSTLDPLELEYATLRERGGHSDKLGEP